MLDVAGRSLAGGVTVVVVLGSGVVVVVLGDVVVVLGDVVVVELSAGAVVVVDGVVIVLEGGVVCSTCARSGPDVVLGGEDSLLVCA
jgi:hypothetical protein